MMTRMDIEGGQTWNMEWIIGGPTKREGARLDKDIVNIDENYIKYILFNPKRVRTVDELEVTDTGTSGHYLTLDSPFNN